MITIPVKSILVMTLFVVVISAMPKVMSAQIKYRSPISGTPNITYFKDDDVSTTVAKRYSCSTTKVYENHQGTDFSVSEGTTVFAAAKGGLYYRVDSCPTYGSLSSTCGGRYGNHVRIDHQSPYDGAGGEMAVYAHMKLGTVVGLSSVLCGARIGNSGSSGQSSGPHLHFEIRPNGFSGSARRDPFAGSCSQTTSYWYALNSSGLPTTTCQP
ncbi:M23 family metallopeptidase [Patescibacteria group bacterium]|nr:M23 family metallopeptidase [Patescibacteria group bacterium]